MQTFFFFFTGLEPFECYAGAVYAVHSDNSVSRTGFTGIATSESGKIRGLDCPVNSQKTCREGTLSTLRLMSPVPAAVPSVLEKVEGNNVNVSWMQIPRGQRRGCITNYTIYLERSGERQVCKKHLPQVYQTVW